MNAISDTTKLVINPAYKFRSDIRRVVITNNDSLYCDALDERGGYTTSFCIIIHPYIARMFSVFNGTNTYKEAIGQLSLMTGLAADEVKSIISPYINNSDKVTYKLSDEAFAVIPKSFIVENKNGIVRDMLQGIDVDQIATNLDIKTYRYYVPNEVYFMLNNTCVVNCQYCYADRQTKVTNALPFERVKELIKEAHDMGCRDFLVGGGEFFLYEHWPELIDTLHQYHYEPFISTKYPLTEAMILILKEKNVPKIQVSIDTINPDESAAILNTDTGYLERLKNTLNLLEKHELKFRVKSVVTKYNDSLDSIGNLIRYLTSFKMLDELSIAPGEVSLYKPFTYRSNAENLKNIEAFVNDVKKKDSRVSMQSFMTDEYDRSIEEKIAVHNSRSTCSGNLTSCYILPDGNVTICEQIYWHPFFNLGNVKDKSILDVWNSKKALSIWNISQDDIRDNSPCKTCKTFDFCRRGQGSCWKMAIAAYGIENYDFPYPQCPHAPRAFKDIYL